MKKKGKTLKVVLLSLLALIIIAIVISVGYVLIKYKSMVTPPDSDIFVDPSLIPTGGLEDYVVDDSGVYGIFAEEDSGAETVAYRIKSGETYDFISKLIDGTFYLYKFEINKNGETYKTEKFFELHVFARSGVNTDKCKVYIIDNGKLRELDSLYEPDDMEICITTDKSGYILLVNGTVDSDYIAEK